MTTQQYFYLTLLLITSGMFSALFYAWYGLKKSRREDARRARKYV